MGWGLAVRALGLSMPAIDEIDTRTASTRRVDKIPAPKPSFRLVLQKTLGWQNLLDQ
jgi:hypothetical protein